MSDVPIAYIVFNRPRHTERTFAAIRAQRPSRLFVVADGPRPGHASDVENCRRVRDIVAQVDWPCDVQRDYAEANLGLKRRVGSGLDRVFAEVERAIVLEDDCLAHPDFFPFCENLLERFAADERIWVVGGSNLQDGRRQGSASYYFSRYNHCWGWATWRRAWRHYESGIPFWPQWKASPEWRALLPDRRERDYWSGIFDRVHRGEIDSWAYPWTASVWRHGGITATPAVNLVSNIGFGPDATHTRAAEDRAGRPVEALGPLVHPTTIAIATELDRYVFRESFGGKYLGPAGLVRRAAKRLHRIVLRAHEP